MSSTRATPSVCRRPPDAIRLLQREPAFSRFEQAIGNRAAVANYRDDADATSEERAVALLNLSATHQLTHDEEAIEPERNLNELREMRNVRLKLHIVLRSKLRERWKE